MAASDRGEHPSADTPHSLGISAGPPTGRKLRASILSSDGGGSNAMKRPASKLVPRATREVVVNEQRGMPRLPSESARDLLKADLIVMYLKL